MLEEERQLNKYDISDCPQAATCNYCGDPAVLRLSKNGAVIDVCDPEVHSEAINAEFSRVRPRGPIVQNVGEEPDD